MKLVLICCALLFAGCASTSSDYDLTGPNALKERNEVRAVYAHTDQICAQEISDKCDAARNEELNAIEAIQIKYNSSQISLEVATSEAERTYDVAFDTCFFNKKYIKLADDEANIALIKHHPEEISSSSQEVANELTKAESQLASDKRAIQDCLLAKQRNASAVANFNAVEQEYRFTSTPSFSDESSAIPDIDSQSEQQTTQQGDSGTDLGRQQQQEFEQQQRQMQQDQLKQQQLQEEQRQQNVIHDECDRPLPPPNCPAGSYPPPPA